MLFFGFGAVSAGSPELTGSMEPIRPPLYRHHRRWSPAQRKQVLVCALFNDVIAVEDHDPVHGQQGRQSVRDGDYGPARAEVLQRSLDELFTLLPSALAALSSIEMHDRRDRLLRHDPAMYPPFLWSRRGDSNPARLQGRIFHDVA
ncbi:hypothetical protein FMEAI12_4320034 [Parafrankia sp. Ea1.12]|nr:hypothetical protein FMEAI12_4320034 [Parafrankia sp. Ea1.12]